MSAFAILDAAYNTAPKLQHLIIRSYAQQKMLEIRFYGTEDYSTLAHNSFLRSKLNRAHSYEHFVFFSFRQFSRDPECFRLLSKFLPKFKFHFAAESISVLSQEEFSNTFPQLFASYLNNQDFRANKLIGFLNG